VHGWVEEMEEGLRLGYVLVRYSRMTRKDGISRLTLLRSILTVVSIVVRHNRRRSTSTTV